MCPLNIAYAIYTQKPSAIYSDFVYSNIPFVIISVLFNSTQNFMHIQLFWMLSFMFLSCYSCFWITFKIFCDFFKTITTWTFIVWCNKEYCMCTCFWATKFQQETGKKWLNIYKRNTSTISLPFIIFFIMILYYNIILWHSRVTHTFIHILIFWINYHEYQSVKWCFLLLSIMKQVCCVFTKKKNLRCLNK